jgi:hypothetical protein
MSDQNVRYYIRFKGRVLGPLTIEKTKELAKRGQITKQHELSPDGVAWKQAQEFQEIFVTDREVVAQATTNEKQKKSSEVEVAQEEWFAHFDDSNQGPVDLQTMKNWIALGKVNQETMVWRSGMAEWQPAELIRPEWFGSRTASRSNLKPTQAQSGSSNTASDSVGELSTTLLRMRGSVLFLAIVGVVIGVMWMIASVAWFFLVATRDGSGPVKVMAVISCIVQVATSICWFTGSVFLLQFGNKLSVLQYRSEAKDIDQGLSTLVRFFKFTAIVVLVWLIIVTILGSIIYLLGLSTPL